MMISRLAMLGAAVLFAAPALADDCAAPIAAMRALPSKSYTTTNTDSRAGQIHTSHAVMVNGQLYIEIAGTWRKSHMTAKAMLDTINDGLQTSKMTCKRGGSETIAGQFATIYDVHNVNQGHASDNRLWISAAGLPLKTENHIQGGMVVVSIYDYAHAVVPPGVK